MHLVEVLSPLLLLAIVLPATGYALGAGSLGGRGNERLAIAVLLGLGVLIWNISVVNLLFPLSWTAAACCLWPVGLLLLRGKARRTLAGDLSPVLRPGRYQLGAGLAALAMLLLLAPLLLRPELVFFDGTSNHDSYFWVTGAEHLRTHNYLTGPIPDQLHPAFNSVGAITGLHPIWGRMGGEGLLAFCAALLDRPAEQVYLGMSAALMLPWLAATLLILRRFFVGEPSWPSTAALALLQPVFLFAHFNANLPNLLGAVFGAAAVLATERALDPGAERGRWLTLLALSVHGLLCCYPELFPFVVVPAGLLWLRRLVWRRGAGLGSLAWTLVCWGAAGLLNPVTTLRAWMGFQASFTTARANQNWAYLFETLEPAELLPGLVSLCPSAAGRLGTVLGVAVSLALVAGLVLALRCARDRAGALLISSGGALLLAYTVYANFHYGWQKSVQFTGAIAAAWTLAALAALNPLGGERRRQRALRLAGFVLLGGFLCLSTWHFHKNSWWWSSRKSLTRDWERLAPAMTHVDPKAALLVDSASFEMAFFHGMWAPYLLPELPLVYALRDPEAAGYLRLSSVREGSPGAPAPSALLVGAGWARTWDANSPRLLETASFSLLRKANRVSLQEGFSPQMGVPNRMAAKGLLRFRPHSASRLLLEFTPARGHQESLKGRGLSYTLRSGTAPAQSGLIAGTPPWKLRLPLVADIETELELRLSPDAAEGPLTPPLELLLLRIENAAPGPAAMKAE